MKKFIVFIITAIILAVATSFTAKAQYAYGQPPQTEQGVSVEKPNFLLMPEYQMAKSLERKGKTMFFEGLGMQAIGAGLLLVPLQTSWVDVSSGTYISEENGLGTAAFIIGTFSTVMGSIMEVIGIFKWAEGASTIRDLRVAYSLSNGGIVVTF